MDYNPPVGGSPGDPYIDANPGGGVEGSPVPAASIEYPQREIVAAITAAGLTPDNGTLDQLASAIQLGTLGAAAAGGTADAITAVFDPVIAALVDGMTVCVRASAANATTTPTFTPAAGTIAAKAMVKGNNLALAAGDIAGAGHWIVLRYDQTLDKWVQENPATGVSAQQYIGSAAQSWQDVKASRALATTYTNTTGGPIQVLVTTYSSTSASAGDFVCAGVTVSSGTQAASGYATMHSVIVPDGATYSVTQAGTGASIYSWAELR